MEKADFAEITRRVIAEQGFSNFLPVALFPKRQHIVVLEGIPADVVHEDAALRWAGEKAAELGDRVYLVAFRFGDSQFKVMHFDGTSSSSAVFDAEAVTREPEER